MPKVDIVLENKTILITGAPGFTGAILILKLLKILYIISCTLIGIDNLSDYYDVSLKQYRLSLIEEEKECMKTLIGCLLKAILQMRAIVSPENYDFEVYKELTPMQPGGMLITYTDVSVPEHNFGFKPSADLHIGLRKFAEYEYSGVF